MADDDTIPDDRSKKDDFNPNVLAPEYAAPGTARWWDQFPKSPSEVAAQTGAAALSSFGVGPGMGLPTYSSPLPREFGAGAGGIQTYVPPTESETFADLGTPESANIGQPVPEMQDWEAPVYGENINEQALRNITQAKIEGARYGLRAERPQQTPPHIPDIAQRKQTPDSIMRTALGAFANPLMLAAIAMGAATRGGARNALAAATGMLKGMNERDANLQKLHQMKFRRSAADTYMNLSREVADYDACLVGDPAEQINCIHAQAAAHQNPSMMEFAREGDPGKIQTAIEDYRKIKDSFAEGIGGWKRAHKAASKAQEKVAEEREAQAAGKPPGMSKADWSRIQREEYEKEHKIGPGSRTAAPADRMLTDQAIAQIGDELVKGNSEPAKRLIPVGRSGAADRAAVANYISENHPDVDLGKAMQSFRGGTSAATTRATSIPAADRASLQRLQIQQDQISQFEQTALGNLKVLIQLGKKVDATGIPAMERWIRAGRQATGDADVAAFHTQYVVTIPEIARILAGNPTLAGQLTDTARREVTEGLPRASNVKQLEASTNVLTGDFERRRSNLAAQIQIVKKRIDPGSFPEPTDRDREVVRNDPTLHNSFIMQFGVEP